MSNHPVPAGFHHERLKLARLAAGQSYPDIGRLLGVTRQYAHRLEVNATPSPVQLERLAQHLRVTEAFFHIPRQCPLEPEQCHFRPLRSATLGLKKTLAAQVEVFETLLQQLEQTVAFPEPRIPDIGDADISSGDAIERLAEQLRRELELGLGPISSMTRLAEKAGVLLIQLTEADARTGSFSLFNERPLIVCSGTPDSACLQRFDLAHEIGHLVLHQGMETGCRQTEEQANRFASALLMPRSAFAAEFPTMRGRYLSWSALGEMKLRWRVSFKALLYRAGRLGLLTPAQVKSGFVHLARHGHARTEALDERLPPESPELVQRAFDLLDHADWQRLLEQTGLTRDVLAGRYRLELPRPRLALVHSA
ncbi:MAG: ImmA/IrrE family metallo-endopeptidase [Thiothrix sp.]|nr:ImmA/IrrE family metallo-endopeptidase [Thiothrix sp.]HPE61007.1 XRE family transcriptional regulator [Thiolinea sp.]